MARKLTSIKDLSREEWLNVRRNSIGGSDAAAACGDSPWTSPLELWCNKLGKTPDKDTTELMRRGSYLEEYVAQRFEEETGKTVHRDNFMYCDDEYDFLTANLDRIVVGEGVGLECKTMNDFANHDVENGEIPTQYYYQVQHYMMIMGWPYMYIAFSGNFKFAWARIDRDDAFIEKMRAQEIFFWKSYVETGKRPPADGSDSCLTTLQLLFPDSVPDVVKYLDVDQMCQRYQDLTKEINELKKEKDAISASICNQLESAEVGLSPGYKVSWKPQTRESLDKDKLKKDHPDIYQKYLKGTTSRVFRVSQKKQKSYKSPVKDD